jgi:hypothetical protein
MKNQSNYDYGQTDPDFIDQNTLVDGTYSNEDQYKILKKDDSLEFGESDPDYMDQETLVDPDNYARDEDPYQYQEEFVEDLTHPKQDFENNNNVNSDNDPNGEPILNNEEKITNDEDNEDVENSLEKDGDLDDEDSEDNDSDEDLYKVSHDPFPGTNPGNF